MQTGKYHKSKGVIAFFDILMCIEKAKTHKQTGHVQQTAKLNVVEPADVRNTEATGNRGNVSQQEEKCVPRYFLPVHTDPEEVLILTPNPT